MTPFSVGISCQMRSSQCPWSVIERLISSGEFHDEFLILIPGLEVFVYFLVLVCIKVVFISGDVFAHLVFEGLACFSIVTTYSLISWCFSLLALGLGQASIKRDATVVMSAACICFLPYYGYWNNLAHITSYFCGQPCRSKLARLS